MSYGQYIVSFNKGTSGHFISNILDRLIVGYTPIIFSDTNNAHTGLYTGIAYPNAADDPKIYEYFEFQPSTVRDYKFSRILTTHTYPNFALINQRYNDIGIILIKADPDDFREIAINRRFKNFKLVPTRQELSGELKLKTKHFEEDTYPENCLIIYYKDIFRRDNDSFRALKQIEDFTGLIATPELIDNYELYVTNQQKLREQYLYTIR